MKSKGRLKNSILKSSLLMVLALIMTVTMVPSVGSVYAAEDPAKATYDKVMRLESPDNYKDETFEPYGYGVDVPFMMNKQSELLFYQTSPDSSGNITTFFDKLKKASTDDVLNGTKTSALKEPPYKLKESYFVKAVSFDPTGTGRDDHIAFIGIYGDGQHAKACVWVYNTVKRSWSSEFDLGSYSGTNCDWMDDDLHVTDYQGTHFLSITAGDYDGDGKDTLVAYAAFTGDDGYSLFELECKDLKVGYFGSNYKGSSLKHDWYGDWVSRKNTIKTKQACELDTGDINGDGLDDLVALTYIGNWGDKSQPAEFYCPNVKVSFGKKGGSGFTKKCDMEYEVWKWIEGWKFNNMVSPGLSLGDVNNDGKDEIITAGIKCLTKKKSEETTEICNELDGDYNAFVMIANEKGTIIYNGTHESNAWTKSGFYPNEDIWNKAAVECVATNGPGNPEQIFINGTLYSYDSDNNKLTPVHTPAYFQNDGDNLSSKASTVMFVQSTEAGNFDGNSKGYEQVAFTVSCKTKDKRSYDYLRGVIGGTKYNDRTGQAGSYYSTAKDKMDDDHAWPGRGKDNASGYISENQGLNCIVVSCDNDNDGFMARYKEKILIAADPEVLCVLQAPPYFEEVKDYLTDTSGTMYQITESYSFEKTTSDSVSFGVGVVAGMESPAMQMEISAGYALDWSKEFSEGHQTDIDIEYKGTEEDLVLVQRKPVVCYYYEIQSDKGTWDGEHMVLSVPCKPGLEPMGIPEYNAFAAYYNKQLEKSSHLKDYQSKAGIPDYMKTTHKLDLLDNKWLGHEGDPFGYIKWTNSLFKSDDRYEILQKTSMKLGHNSETSSWGKTESNSVGETENMSHGFTYDSTIAMGPNVGAASLYVGLSSSLQYMTGESTTTTKTQAQGISCEVCGLKVKDMPASLRGNDYNFSFKMARWPSGIKRYVNGKAEDVPVYGYALSSVTAPSEDENITVQDQLDASEVTEMISELPALEEITSEDEEAIQEIRNMYEDLSDSAKTLVDEDEIIAFEDRIELQKMGGMNLENAKIKLSKTSYTYDGKTHKPTVVTVNDMHLIKDLDYTVKYSAESPKNAGTYTVTLTGKGLVSGTAKATFKINPSKDFAKAQIKLSKTKYTYDGKAKKPTVKSVTLKGKTLAEGVDYKVSYAKGRIDTGTYKVTVNGINNYSGSIQTTFTIEKATNTLKATGKTAKVKYSKLKNANQTVARKNVLTVSGAKGTLTYAKVKGNAKITINKTTGKVTVKKGLKKGKYTVKVKIKAKGTKNYKPKTLTRTFYIKVV